ncbi:hypothetical protein Tco_0218602 [Tanacetum coccineum]
MVSAPGFGWKHPSVWRDKLMYRSWILLVIPLLGPPQGLSLGNTMVTDEWCGPSSRQSGCSSAGNTHRLMGQARNLEMVDPLRALVVVGMMVVHHNRLLDPLVTPCMDMSNYCKDIIQKRTLKRMSDSDAKEIKAEAREIMPQPSTVNYKKPHPTISLWQNERKRLVDVTYEREEMEGQDEREKKDREEGDRPYSREFAGELAHIAPIPPGIVEADFDPNDDTSSDDDDFEESS